MTEAEWLAGNKTEPMLNCVRLRGGSRRKFTLLVLEYCRPLLHLVTDQRIRDAAGLAKKSIETGVPRSDLDRAHAAASEAVAPLLASLAQSRSQELIPFWQHPANPALCVAAAIRHALSPDIDALISGAISARLAHANHRFPQIANTHEGWLSRLRAADNELVPYIRCVFGNPFRPDPIERTWKSGTVTAIANGIYEERAFDRLPILGDALEEAGCMNAEVLGHCREGGGHLRGCHIVDSVLDRT